MNSKYVNILSSLSVTTLAGASALYSYSAYLKSHTYPYSLQKNESAAPTAYIKYDITPDEAKVAGIQRKRLDGARIKFGAAGTLPLEVHKIEIIDNQQINPQNTEYTQISSFEEYFKDLPNTEVMDSFAHNCKAGDIYTIATLYPIGINIHDWQKSVEDFGAERQTFIRVYYSDTKEPEPKIADLPLFAKSRKNK